MSVDTVLAETRLVTVGSPRKRFTRMTERNILGYQRAWPLFVTGIVEPLFFLFSIGIGVGELVGDVTYAGRSVPFESFIASGMLATAAMNGAVFDTTFNFFIRLKYFKLYDAILATPLEPRDVALGEVAWALMRGTFYSFAFLVTMTIMGLVESWWAVLALPATVLVGAAFASIGIAGASYMRSYLDFDFVNLAIMPMFLFSATFFPLSEYPSGIAVLVQCTPLYQGVDLCRGLTMGELDISMLGHVAYLVVMVSVCVSIGARRINAILRA